MQRAESLSRFLTAILIPLCAWGLICALVLHLIELRSLFVLGGEWRLRQATLAFAAGVVLLQRLAATQGKSVARGYGIALGVAITLFALHNAFAYRLPAHPLLVFLFNESCFLILWWVGHKIISAYSRHFDEADTAAMEFGILARRRLWKREPKKELTDEEREAQWRERLKGRHPGLVLLYFSLFAIPAFGLGIYLFEPDDLAARFRLGVLLFIYLWCAFCLLFLSSLNQLRAYFEKRDVSLPEMIGLSWLVIGFLVSTLALIAAIFLPQPPSMPGAFVRSRIASVYRGWESRYGVKDTVGRGGKQPGGSKGSGGEASGGDVKYWDAKSVEKALNSRHSEIDKLNDDYISEMKRNTGAEPEYRNMITLAAAVNDSFRDIFDGILKGVGFLVILCGIVVILILLVAFWRGLAEGIGSLRKTRPPREPRRRRRRKREEAEAALKGRKFLEYRDPFLPSSGERTGDALVRYLWEATLAFCSDFGTPCTADRTPLEFVGEQPGALEGFEDSARYIAETITFSEFSGQPVPKSTFPALKQFWQDLKEHAARMM